MANKSLKSKELAGLLTAGKEIGKRFEQSSIKDLINVIDCILNNKEYKSVRSKTENSFTKSFEETSEFKEVKKSYLSRLQKLVSKMVSQNPSNKAILKIEEIINLYKQSPLDFLTKKLEFVHSKEESSFSKKAQPA